MRRFLSEGVADVITSSERELSAGQAVERDAAVLMLDIRAFTPFATSVSPHVVVEALTLYHGLVVPIVERHGGTIHVESVPNEGSCFRLALPRIDVGGL